VRDDGAALAACVNAACAAAVDAGVPLSGLLGACVGLGCGAVFVIMLSA
jgi:ribonuclease PH